MALLSADVDLHSTARYPAILAFTHNRRTWLHPAQWFQRYLIRIFCPLGQFKSSVHIHIRSYKVKRLRNNYYVHRYSESWLGRAFYQYSYMVPASELLITFKLRVSNLGLRPYVSCHDSPPARLSWVSITSNILPFLIRFHGIVGRAPENLLRSCRELVTVRTDCSFEVVKADWRIPMTVAESRRRRHH
jgi:hypothetical protein